MTIQVSWLGEHEPPRRALATRRRCGLRMRLRIHVETASVADPIFQWAAMKLSLECTYLLLASLCASAGAISDARSRRIPNLLTGTSIAFGLLLHLETGGWRQMGMAAVAGLAGGAVFFIFFVVGAMGAGDLKLMAAISLIAGFGYLAELFLAIAFTGGVFALVLAISRGRLRTTLANVVSLIQHHAASGALPHPDLNLDNPHALRLPYSVAIAAGCWIVVLMQLVPR
jgi:prepilin peptidase CpaA